jgi:hypothetical protein
MEDLILKDRAAMFSLGNKNLADISFMTWCAMLCPKARASELFQLVPSHVQNYAPFTKTLMAKDKTLFLPKHLRELFLPFYLDLYKEIPAYDQFDLSEWQVIVNFDGRYLHQIPMHHLQRLKTTSINRKIIKQQQEFDAYFTFLCCALKCGILAPKRLLKKIGNYLDLKHFKPMAAWKTKPVLNVTYAVGRKHYAEQVAKKIKN